MALSRQWHSARTQSSEIKGKWNRHTEQSDLPKSAQPDLLTPSLSLLWLLLRRWSWLIEIALFTDYHFNNLTSYVRNPAWGMFFLMQSVCYLHFSQVGTKIRLVGYSFYLHLGLCPCHSGIVWCYCCSCILTWQGNILVTRKWKLKTKMSHSPHIPEGKKTEHNINKKSNKPIFKNKSWSRRSWVISLCICVHAPSPWQLSCCVQFLFFECRMGTTAVFCFDISVSSPPSLPFVSCFPCHIWLVFSVDRESLPCSFTWLRLNWPPHSFEVLNRWITTLLHAPGYCFLMGFPTCCQPENK